MITSAEWLAFAASGIGVIGTLAGAAIAQSFANKREHRQWDQSRESQAELWAREDSLRFHSDKKAAYAAFISKMHLWMSQMHSQLHEDYGGQAYGPSGGFDKFETEVTELRSLLELIAPVTVWMAADVAWGAGCAIALTLAVPDRYSKEKREANVSDFTRYLRKCIKVMRDDLIGDRKKLASVEPPSTNP
jgi:hypothetical protein